MMNDTATCERNRTVCHTSGVIIGESRTDGVAALLMKNH